MMHKHPRHHHDHCEFDDCSHDHLINHPYIHPDRCATESDDQIPTFSRVGRGIKGDSFRVLISKPDSCTETYLEGQSYDEATKTWSTEWYSENINGGELSYQYNFRPYNVPPTFTITFIYRRPVGIGKGQERHHTGVDPLEPIDQNEHSWSWTTPDIPYYVDFNEDGKPDYDGFIGSGVATLFVRASKAEDWKRVDHERLHYPDQTTWEDYNAPFAEDPWSATVTFGHDGDVKLPNFPDLDRVLGADEGASENWASGENGDVDGEGFPNYKEWVKKKDKELSDHFHKDLGFNSDGHASTGAFGGEDTVKKYIDKKLKDLKDDFDEQMKKKDAHINNLYFLIDDLINHIYGATKSEVTSGSTTETPVSDGKDWKITWNPKDAKIPQGNINLFSGSTANYIRTRDGEENNDVKAV